MNAKTLFSAVVMGWCWACATAWGQTGLEAPPVAPIPPTPALLEPLPVAPPPHVPSGGLSDWITYRRPDCCSSGPVHPLYSELFFRVGPSFVMGGNFLGRELQTGWTIGGGVRALLFDTAMTSAWTVEAHIVNSNNSGGGLGQPVVLNIFVPDEFGQAQRQNVPVTVRNFNRTMVGLGFGRQYYLWEPANFPGGKWRAGWDTGGRYGSASMRYHEIEHRTDVIGGVWAAAHTDYEVPCGRCFLQYGLRLEWAYTWSDILQRQSDVQELNLLVNFGIRY